MKKSVLTICFLLLVWAGIAQKKPAGNVDATKAQLNKMMEDAMKQQNLTPEQKAQVRQMMDNAVKQANANPGMTSNSGPAKIIAKQTALLAHIPKLANAAALQTYVQKLKDQASKTIPAKTRQQVDALLSKYQNNTAAIINLGPALWMRKSSKAAIYAAIRGAQLSGNNVTAKNNMAVILQQAGYPQHAIPVLDYLNTQNPQNATILNNIGQCYLSLGDTQKAKTYFMGCLRIDANQPEANCGTALILEQEGKTTEATPYAQKAMKNGYSEALEDMINSTNMKLDFDATKPPVPDYFNPQKYKPVPAVKKMADIGPILTQREAMHNFREDWSARLGQVTDNRENKIQGENANQWAARIYGFVPGTPFTARAKFMFIYVSRAYAEWGAQISKDRDYYLNKAKELQKKLDADIDAMYKNGEGNTTYEACVKQKALLEKYLAESSFNHESYERKSLHKHYDFVNEELHWARFLLNSNEYRNLYFNIADKFVDKLADYDEFQRLSTAENIMRQCDNLLKNPPKKLDPDDPKNTGCPVKIGVPLGAASVKADCNGWEIGGGELFVFDIERNSTEGELTIAFGLGGELETIVGGAGAKGQLFFKLDKDYMPADCGMRFEGAIEANTGPIILENKATLTIGLTSGASLDVVHNNVTSNIFNLDPSK